ncbi:MAG: leucyl/phenylalanyl-tRNA--protein transferase [Bdellovibrio sp.]
MPVVNFPPIELADEHGLLAIGGDLSPSTLKLAYQRGIFPWPINEEYPLAWFSPDPRGIIEWKNIHLSQSLRKFLKKTKYSILFNSDFDAVINGCRFVTRKGQHATWITDDIVMSYRELFNLGLAYCVEVRDQHKLVGGLYGVCIDGIMSGESMFHLEDNASKLALLAVLYSLHKAGIDWLDTQMVTPVVQHLGGKEIPRDLFINKILSRKKIQREKIFNQLAQDWVVDLLEDVN